MRKTLITIGALILLAFSAGSVFAGTNKVVVCKYVSIPAVDERLQTGQNPIVVSVSALKGFDGTFPYAFNDKHVRSLAIRYAVNSHDGSLSECPTSITIKPTPTPSASPSATPSVTPSVNPSVNPSVTPSVKPVPNTALFNDGTDWGNLIAMLGVFILGLALGRGGKTLKEMQQNDDTK